MAEWFKAHAWKVCWVERLSQVRILFSPPNSSENPNLAHFYDRARTHFQQKV